MVNIQRCLVSQSLREFLKVILAWAIPNGNNDSVGEGKGSGNYK